MMCKRGQFFILAAVILSAIILSFGSIVNEAKTNQELDSFRDFSYEVERETGAVLDYEVYSGFDDDANITHFVELLSQELSNQDPEANFFFIYGDHYSQTIWNEGDSDVSVGNGDDRKLVGGSGKIFWSSVTTDGGFTIQDEISSDDYDEDAGRLVLKSDLCVSNAYIPESCIDQESFKTCCHEYCTTSTGDGSRKYLPILTEGVVSQLTELAESMENKDFNDLSGECVEKCAVGEEFRVEGADSADGDSTEGEDRLTVKWENTLCNKTGFSEECVNPDGCSGKPTLTKDTIINYNLGINGNEISFPFSRYKKVVFVVQKEVEGENFVATS